MIKNNINDFKSLDASLGFYKDDKLAFISFGKGISPLLAIIENKNSNFAGNDAIDKIVGKAAAFLFILIKVKSIHALTISKDALVVLEEANIKVTYEVITENIKNRAGDDICPMEKVVKNINEPLIAYKALKDKVDELKKEKNMKPKVYFIREITPENILKCYEALGISLKGNIAVKIHSGEEGNQNYLTPKFMKPIIDFVKGTIVECNTAYEGSRNETGKHIETIHRHGFDALAKIDIMDSEGELILPIENHLQIDKDYVGSHLNNYDGMLVFSHFKGHPMGGYGGALKQLSIGCASGHGKAYIHGAGDVSKIWTCEQDKFLESMADSASAVANFFKGNIAYVNVACNLSVDCDCCSKAEDPCMKDIGIFASLDPVAIDQACLDAVYNSEDPGKEHFIERVETRHGLHTIEAAVKLGVGSTEYELVEIK